ncbi:MAG: hypothetical protein AABZ74_15755 [Cyanobacteriota bacterium]
MSNILIVYSNFHHPIRSTMEDHLYCFKKYSNEHNIIYVNVRVTKDLSYLTKINFDLIIFTTMFVCSKSDLDVFKLIIDRCRVLKKINAIKVMQPQDEFINTDILCDFINEFEINNIFSVAPESEWKKIYPTINFDKTKFYPALTGYLDKEKNDIVLELEKQIKHRDIDIGYRAALWGSSASLGRFGYLKYQIAKIFQDKAPKKGIDINISTNSKDFLLGNDWIKFLLRCKYVIGVESGAGILDVTGEIKIKTEKFIEQNPNASFEEVEENCFKGLDGNLKLTAISPRHLECCVTKTCQILIEGEYNGILEPWKHYIPVKKDFSNIDEVLEIIKKDELREKIVENAYNDIVLSGKYDYSKYVKFIIDNSLKKEDNKDLNLKEKSFFFYSSIKEKEGNFKVLIKNKIEKMIPKNIFMKIKNFEKSRMNK